MLKKKHCEWQNTDLTTQARWHTGMHGKLTLTTTGSNDMTDLQIEGCLSWVGTLRARSNLSDWEGLCKCLGSKFLKRKWLTLGKGLLVALGRDLSERALILLEKTLYMKAKWKQKKQSKRQ